MTARTQITIDPETQRRAHAKAAELGIPFAEYVRRLIAQDLGPARGAVDISLVFNLVDEGARTNVARDKDKMIAEALWKEHRQKTGKKRQARLRLRGSSTD
jgi:hypothetical protein